MNSFVKEVILLAAAGTAGFCAYKWMSPSARREISRDMKRTVDDMCDVKKDMGHMAATIKDTF